MKKFLTPPPDFPEYFIRHRHELVIQDLIRWAKKEYQDQLICLAENGYWKELKRRNEEYSPMRILSEIPNLRKICASLDEERYNKLKFRDRVFLRRSYELYEHLR